MSPAGRCALPAAAACFAFAALTASLFHPGRLSPDSVEQFAQGVSGDFTDRHPSRAASLLPFRRTGT
jgi:hypothetical protein